DLVVAALIVVVLLEATEDLHGGVALLGWCRFVLCEDGIDERMEGPADGCGVRLGARVRPRLGLAEGLADLVARVVVGAGDVANAHAVAVREADLGVVVHGQHPCLRCRAHQVMALIATEAAGVGLDCLPICWPGVGLVYGSSAGLILLAKSGSGGQWCHQ